MKKDQKTEKKEIVIPVFDRRANAENDVVASVKGTAAPRYTSVEKVEEDPEIAALSRFLFETENINPGPVRISVIPVNKEKMMVRQKNGIVGAPSPTQGVIAKVIGINKFATKALESGVKIGSHVICSTQVGSHVHTSEGEVWTIYELDILNIFNDYPADEQETEKH